MAMETSASETGADPVGAPARNQNGQGDRFYGVRNRGAGLYAEVKPLRESRSLTPDEHRD